MIFHHIDYYCANCFTKPDIMSVLFMYVCMYVEKCVIPFTGYDTCIDVHCTW